MLARRRVPVLGRLLIAWLIWPAAVWAAPPQIDLTRAPWFIRQGFGPEDAAGFDPQTGRPAGAFPIAPNRIFGVPAGDAFLHYTLETRFRLAAVAPLPGGLLGVTFSAIGEGWEVYVNGARIAGEMPLGDDGRLAYRRSLRDVTLPIPPDVLRAGENSLVVHLAGNAPRTPFAWNTWLGFYKRSGYEIGPYSGPGGLHDAVGLALVSVFFFFGAYAFVLFAYRPSDQAHLYFGALASSLAVYFFTRTAVVYAFVRDTAWLSRIEYASLSLAGPLMLLFLHEFFGERPSGFMRLYGGVSALLLAGCLALPVGYLDLVLMGWQALSLGGAAYMAVLMARALIRRKPHALPIVPGLTVLVAATAWDIADTIWVHGSRQFGGYAFALLILNLAAVITARTLHMRAATKAAVGRTSESEARLRALFEAGFEAIVMSSGGRIVDANPAFARMFGYPAGETIGRQVSELFARPGGPPVQPGAETLLRRADGGTFIAECWQLVSREGYATLVVRDVDATRRAANDLAERNHELEVLVRSMADREKRMRELENELAARHPKKP
jgi:PAS domain-containing protein